MNVLTLFIVKELEAKRSTTVVVGQMATLLESDGPDTALRIVRDPQHAAFPATMPAAAATTTPPASPIIRNPYKRQKCTPSPPSSVKIPSSLGKIDEATPFYAALLRLSVREYVESEQHNDSCRDEKLKLWHLLCRRMELAIPENCLLPHYDDPKRHFQLRAALVLEEARHSLATTLASRWTKPKPPRTTNHHHLQQEEQQKHSIANGTPFTPVSTEFIPVKTTSPNSISYPWFHAQVVEHEPRAGGTLQVTFQLPWEPDKTARARTTQRLRDQFTMGTVLECRLGRYHRLSGSFLAWTNDPSQTVGTVLQSRRFSVLLFHSEITPERLQRVSKWSLRPVDQCTSHQRQFTACFVALERRVPFLPQLLGGTPDPSVPTPSTTTQESAAGATRERGMPLNASQEKAVVSFLNSAPGTITIVQGYVYGYAVILRMNL